MSLTVRFALALLLHGCVAVPPARAPEPSPSPPSAAPVSVPAPASAPEHTRIAECPLFEGKRMACGDGLGVVCTRDPKGCERCECKRTLGSEGHTVEDPDLDPRQH